MNTSLRRQLPTLLQFLTSARHCLKSSLENARPLHIVTGNESADLDSFASSILYAYFSGSSGAHGSHQTVPIPLLPIPRADLNLRPEFLYILREINLPPHSLFFVDDFPEGTLRKLGNTFSLVDHNVLQPIFESTGGRGEVPDGERVKSIIDHHVDEGRYLNAGPRVVEVAGSCSSLVTEYFSKEMGLEDEMAIEPEIAKLGLAAILIDTANMEKRVTGHDETATKILEARLKRKDGEGEKTWDRTAFYTALQNAKSSIDNLSLRDILRKDYKEWFSQNPDSPTSEKKLKLGISSTVKPLSYLISKEPEGKSAFISTTSSWATERELDVFALMTSHTDEHGEYHRDLFLWILCHDPTHYDQSHIDIVSGILSKFISEAEEHDFKLEEFGNGELGDNVDFGGKKSGNTHWKVMRAWKQGNLAASRKQVGPVLRGCL